MSYREVFLKHVLTLTICGKDAYFNVVVDVEYGRFSAMDRDPMCDAYNMYTEKTGKVRVSVVPTDPFHNYFQDMETLSVYLNTDVARKLISRIKDDENDLMWFTKDRVSYAAKHGELI